MTSAEQSIIFAKFAELLAVLGRKQHANENSHFSTLWEGTSSRIRTILEESDDVDATDKAKKDGERTEVAASFLAALINQNSAEASPKKAQLKPKKKASIKFAEEEVKESKENDGKLEMESEKLAAAESVLAEKVEGVTLDLVVDALSSQHEDKQQVKFATRLLKGPKSQGFFRKLNLRLFPNHPAIVHSGAELCDDESILFLLQHWILIQMREGGTAGAGNQDLAHLGVALSKALKTSKAKGMFYKTITGTQLNFVFSLNLN